MDDLKLQAGQLRRVCDPESLPFATTASVEGPVGMIGQDRAVRAFEFGLSIRRPGCNIYMAGVTGTGKTTYSRNYLEERAAAEPVPGDWCYLYNFADPDHALAVELEPGAATGLARAMEELVEDLKREVPRAFSSEEYERRKNALAQGFQEASSAILIELERQVQAAGFALARVGSGFATVPAVEGRPMAREEFEALSMDQREQLESRAMELQELVGRASRKLAELELQGRSQMQALDQEIGRLAISGPMTTLTRRYGSHTKLAAYFKAVETDILERLNLFREAPPAGSPGQPFQRYRVNILVNNGSTKGAPVIMETNPTYANLCGTIEYRGREGVLTTDFTMIKPGALHRANGGYILLQVADVLKDPMAWAGLKRALKNQEVRAESVHGPGLIIPAWIQPEPIPLKVKVVLIGHPLLYRWLYALDEDFRKLFKIKAEFDTIMDRTPENTLKYARFVASVCRQAGLRHLDRAAVAKVVEYGSRLASDQSKLSTRFNEISDVIHEADGWAGSGEQVIGAAHVQRALAEKDRRVNLIEDRLQELIARGVTMVSTQGAVVGQVNGVAVYDTGDHRFAKPSRITARTFAGRDGVINIERETAMSGAIHSKGVLILSGYLGGKYAHSRPLALNASIGFEQVYEEVDGDSASSTELYALLSSLANAPIKQGLAVTGSVNQHGEVQPIGGVNEKIEGFYATCLAQGLTGEQGVLIPVQNVQHLMLSEETTEAIQAGRFHVWAVSHIDQGVEILTGVTAGVRRDDGTYPPESIHGRVDARLEELAEIMRRHGRP
jgi:lon-related putative ATP-dependent protease